MVFWDFTRTLGGVGVLVEFAREQGLSVEALLTGSRLATGQLDDPNAEISAVQELCVVANLLRLSTLEPARLGYRVGVRFNFSSYGMWGFGLVSSATAADALQLALRFLPLTYAFTQVTYRVDGTHGVLSFGEPDLRPELRRFLLARDMAAVLVLLREVLGADAVPEAVTLRWMAPPASRPCPELAELPDGVLRYGQACNSIVLSRTRLNRPLPHANPLSASLCEQQCQALLERRRLACGTAAIVRHYLSLPGCTPPDLAGMARMLNSSERTLKRRLKEEGTTFRTLLMDVRSDRAIELLRDEHIGLADIAARLGFSDPSSFSQAFKRWHGLSPKRWRQRVGP